VSRDSPPTAKNVALNEGEGQYQILVALAFHWFTI